MGIATPAERREDGDGRDKARHFPALNGAVEAFASLSSAPRLLPIYGISA